MAPPTSRPAVAIDSPADLRRVMNADFEVSDEQWAAISAPLEPAVVVAGAGSGKTTLMAARVVYLVATGAVAPDEVLGLTFTTKAAAELRSRIREALAAAGHGRGAALEPDEELSEPTVATYNAYAAGLLTEHGLRIGHEPDTRVMADASRYQLAARAIARHRGEVLLLSDSPQHVIDWMLALESAMSEHLVDEGQVRDFTLSARAAFEAELAVKDTLKQRELVAAQDKRLELLGLVRTYRGLKADLGLMDFSDQIALAARLAAQQPEVGVAERAPLPGGAARRVPGHLGGAGPDARPPVLRDPTRSTAGATRSRRSATRTRPSTAGGARRCRTSSASARTSRPPTVARTLRRCR